MINTELFKGIALFTPGGDIIYCISPNKQDRWHSHLCSRLQEILDLNEPPHFLIPGYTATVDRWRDPITQQVKTVGEVYPPLQRHEALLNAIFATNDLIWQTASWLEDYCSPIVIESYRSVFPQLWENHDLIVRLESNKPESSESSQETTATGAYILRLFVSGNSVINENFLRKIHNTLETGLQYPYTLKVIDISKYPEQAEIHQVSATPTLVRVWPEPMRKIVGEVEDGNRILQILTK